jgi:hypothetical protein
MTVKVIKLYNNTYIIGKEDRYGDATVTIKDPYMLFPDPSGIMIMPYDEVILGKKIKEIKVKQDQILYNEEPSETLRNQYLEQLSGIEIPKQDIIT